MCDCECYIPSDVHITLDRVAYIKKPVLFDNMDVISMN